jgi:cytochrome c biogenesis protein CcmG/thiol:disulfide interchange protein DsbE
MDLSTDEPIAPTTGPSAAPPVVARTDDRVWKALAAATAVILIGFVAYVATRPHHSRSVAFPSSPAPTLPLGTPAPAFSLAGLGGGPPVTLAATRGTPTVVNFFASWCPDCRAELAAFGALADRTAGRVDVIGVDSNDNDGAAARALLSEAKATYPVGLDPDARVATSYRLSALPVTYFLDGQGRVVHVAFGTQSPASLAKWTAALTRSSARAGGPS